MSSNRKSNRLANKEPEAPPSATSFPAGSANRALLATDFKNGKPDHRADSAKSWKIERWSTAAADDGNEDDCSPLNARQLMLAATGAAEEENDELQCNEEAETDSADNHKHRDDRSMKLLPFAELKQFVESNCKCKHCGCPVVLSQETMGIAMNLHLCCVPKSAGAKIWHEKMLAAEKLQSSKTNRKS